MQHCKNLEVGKYYQHDEGAIIKVLERVYQTRQGKEVEGVKFQFITSHGWRNAGETERMWSDCRFVKELMPKRGYNTPLWKVLNGGDN